MNEEADKSKGCLGVPWRIIGVVVLIVIVLTPAGRISNVESKFEREFRSTNITLTELKETIDRQQRQIDDMKREVEEMKRKQSEPQS